MTRLLVQYSIQLVGSGETPKEAARDTYWLRVAMLLYYETHRPARADDWCMWLCGKSPNQIREEARGILDWGTGVNEPQILVFDAGGCDNKSWLVGVGDHASFKRPTANRAMTIHGLVPERLVKRNGGHPSNLLVPVGKDFTSEHLSIAARLYEANEALRRPEEAPRSELWNLAQDAVNTARLVLA